MQFEESRAMDTMTYRAGIAVESNSRHVVFLCSLQVFSYALFLQYLAGLSRTFGQKEMIAFSLFLLSLSFV